MNAAFGFWNSLETLNTIKEGIAITLVALAVIGFFVDRRATKLQRIEDTKKEAELATTKTQAKEARELAALAREQQAPRIINPDQEQQMLAILKPVPKGPVQIECPAGDGEAIDLRNRLIAILKIAGFDPNGGLALSAYKLSTGELLQPTGLILQIKDAERPPQHANAIAIALNKIGMTADLQANAALNVEGVRIVVGGKPKK